MNKVKFYKRKFGKTVERVVKIVLLVLLTIVTGFVIFKLDYFRISEVEVVGAKNFVSSVDLKELAKSRSVGDHILFFDKTSLIDSLERNFQGAKHIKISRKLPSTIVVKVTERNPLAVVKDSSGEHYLVDEDGYALGKVDPSKTNLPKVNYSKKISVGYVLEPELVSVFLSLLQALDDEKILVSNLTVTPRYLSFRVDKGSIEVLISNEKDKQKSVGVLGNLLEKLSSEGKEPSLIDLRYDKVVVSYR